MTRPVPRLNIGRFDLRAGCHDLDCNREPYACSAPSALLCRGALLIAIGNASLFGGHLAPGECAILLCPFIVWIESECQGKPVISLNPVALHASPCCIDSRQSVSRSYVRLAGGSQQQGQCLFTTLWYTLTSEVHVRQADRRVAIAFGHSFFQRCRCCFRFV